MQKPVSQHHPLHSYNSPLVPPAVPYGVVRSNNDVEDDEEEELDEDGIATYGLLYHSFSKDSSQNPEAVTGVGNNSSGFTSNNKDTQSVNSETTSSRLSPYEAMMGFGVLPFNPS